MVAFTHRDLTLYDFDPAHAHVIGLRPRRLEALLLGLLAVTVVSALQVLGIIMVVAMLIIPGATAYLLTDRFERMMLIAVATSVAASVVGVYASFLLDVAPGGMIVLVQALLFAAAYLLAPRYGLLSRPAGARRDTAPSSREGKDAKSPSRPTMGVRAADTMTTGSDMGFSFKGPRAVRCGHDADVHKVSHAQSSAVSAIRG